MRWLGACALSVFSIPVWAQYAGPAVLSRGEAPAAIAQPNIRFRPYVEVMGSYESGLARTATANAAGVLGTSASAGAEISFGVGGNHTWRHTKLGLDYHGSFNHYIDISSYDSITQSLLLGLSHQFTPHIDFSLNESAGIYSRDYGLLGISDTVPFDPSTTYIPTNDYFNSRTYYSSTQAALTIQRTARLSFSLKGGAYLTRRQYSALNGSTIENANGDVQYRLTRRSTIGASYSYMHITYTKVYGGTDAHSASGSYSLRLSRRAEFSGYLGASRVETTMLTQAPVDPQIAVLLGITGTAQISHVIGYLPTWGGRVSRVMSKGSLLYASAGRSVIPGNGLFLTSYSTSVAGGYTHPAGRRWSFVVQSAISHSSAVGAVGGDYSTYSGGISFARHISSMLHFVAGYEARQYESGTYSLYNRLVHTLHAGFGFAPGDVPLRIW